MAQYTEPMSATLDLAGAVVALMDGLTGKSMPEPLLDAARNVLLDHLSAPNGHQDDPVVIAAVELGDSLGNSTTTIRAAGSDRAHDVFAAAFVTGAATGTGVTGSGASVWAGRFVAPALGAALAIGQLRPVSGKRWLSAFVLGCEIHMQSARALGRHLVERGWDPTGPCGVLGAATAAALIVGTDVQSLATTWGVAVGQTLGHGRAADSGLAGLHAGQAAANGVLAALLVEAGFTASSRVFEAPRGVLTALVGHHNTSRLLAGWGEWTLPAEVASVTSPIPPVGGGQAVAASPALAAAIKALDRAPDLGDLLDALDTAVARSTQ